MPSRRDHPALCPLFTEFSYFLSHRVEYTLCADVFLRRTKRERHRGLMLVPENRTDFIAKHVSTIFRIAGETEFPISRLLYFVNFLKVETL